MREASVPMPSQLSWSIGVGRLTHSSPYSSFHALGEGVGQTSSARAQSCAVSLSRLI
jgi:hypothetical protein